MVASLIMKKMIPGEPIKESFYRFGSDEWGSRRLDKLGSSYFGGPEKHNASGHTKLVLGASISFERIFVFPPSRQLDSYTPDYNPESKDYGFPRTEPPQGFMRSAIQEIIEFKRDDD
jgi:hypothetical protein